METEDTVGLKLLILAPAGNIHTVRWVNALVSRGNQVYLAYLPNHAPSQHQIDRRVKLLPLSHRGSPGYYLNARGLNRIVKKIRPDLINAHYASGYGTLARISRVRPLVLSVWGSDVYAFPYKSPFHYNVVRSNIGYSNAITSSSHCMADQVVRISEDSRRKLSVVPFGVDLDLFRKKNRQSRIDDDIVIGNIKTLKSNYRIGDLIRATDHLLKMLDEHTAKRIRVDIYGDGPLRSDLEEMIDGLGLSGRVRLLGSIPNTEVPDKLESMDIFCVTSQHESFGVAVIEAMAMELPVVASDVPGFREVLGEDLSEGVVPVGDPMAIAVQLQAYIQNLENTNKFGAAARERVEEFYDWDLNVSAMLEVYDTTVRNHESELR